MNIDFARIFSLNYLFALQLADFQPAIFNFLITLASLMLVLGTVAKIVSNKKLQPTKKFWEKISSLLWVISILLFLFIFFRQQQIVFLSMPIWLIILFLLTVFWLTSIIRYALFKMPVLKNKIKLKKQNKKYLP